MTEKERTNVFNSNAVFDTNDGLKGMESRHLVFIPTIFGVTKTSHPYFIGLVLAHLSTKCSVSDCDQSMSIVLHRSCGFKKNLFQKT